MGSQDFEPVYRSRPGADALRPHRATYRKLTRG